MHLKNSLRIHKAVAVAAVAASVKRVAWSAADNIGLYRKRRVRAWARRMRATAALLGHKSLCIIFIYTHIYIQCDPFKIF